MANLFTAANLCRDAADGAIRGGVNLSHEARLNFGEKRAWVTARVARGSEK